MIIRPITAADLTAIATIQSLSPEAAQWTPADYLAHDCRVAEADGAVAGFLAARQVAPGEWEILNLAVAPSQRRRGVARALVSSLLSERRATFFLEVRESNSAALAFYASAGFRPITKRPQYYHNPVEAAIVMQARS
jgi:[ribosomal protein S18]-alanine N-acetyltransferase